MKKDAYYFPHFSNARHDRKLRRVRKELGVEGYGIYFMLLETLRDQETFNYPVDDIDLLADEFGTSEQKIRTVICNYDLFQVDSEQNFFSMKFVEYLQPYLDNKHRNRINGIKGNLIKYGYISKDDSKNLTDVEILELDSQRRSMELIPMSGGDSGGDSGGEQPSDRKESKEKKSKVNKNKGIYRKVQHLELSVEDYEKLSVLHLESEINDILDDMENWAKLKNKKSAYLTANNWLKRKFPNRKEKPSADIFANFDFAPDSYRNRGD